MKTNTLKQTHTKKNKYGFTLVELIVVITILVILGTIGFLSLGGYSSNARDSDRVSAISNIKKSLDLTYIKTSSYPTPTNGTTVTFSGGTVWTQGSIGTSVLSFLSSAGFKFSKIPTDPTYQNTYTYSLLNTGKEYQIATIMENRTAASYEPLITKTYAADNIVAYVGGNYNGLVAKVQTGTTTYYLTLPSIILSNLSNTELTVPAIQSGNLVLNSKGNLPSTYTLNGVTSTTPSITFSALTTSDQLTNGSGILAYSTTGSLDTAGVSVLMNNLYTIYSASSLKTDSTSAGSVTSLMSIGSGSTALVNLYNGLVSSSVGGPTGPSWNITAGGDCTLVDNTLGSDGNTSTCTDNRTYTMQGGATHDKTYNLLKIEGKWWFNENLAYPPVTGYKGSGTWSASDLGYYSCPGISWQSNVNCTFVSTRGYLYQWSAAMNGAASNSGTNGREQGICPSGWAIPTKLDLSSTGSTYWPDPASDGMWIGATAGWIRFLAGYRDPTTTGTFSGYDGTEKIWSSLEDTSVYAYSETFGSGNSFRYHTMRGHGLSIRCIKN